MMPGTRPMRRRRRLAPVPCASRLRALISIAIFVVLLSEPGPATRHRWLRFLFDKERRHRFLGVNAQDRLGDEAGDRQAADLLASAGFLAQRNGIGDHELVEVGLLDAVHRRAGEYGVRAI